MLKTRRRNQAREQFWRATVAAWRQSGQSVRAFCAARGVSEATFFARRRELIDRALLPQPTAPAPAVWRGSPPPNVAVLHSGLPALRQRRRVPGLDLNGL